MKEPIFKQARPILLKREKTLQQIQKNPVGNLGGLVVLLETNMQFTDSWLLPSEALGFTTTLHETNSLANLAYYDQITIDKVLLNSGCVIEIHLRNNTSEPLLVSIPKGSIFENQIAQSTTQNLTTATNNQLHLAPRASGHLMMSGFCLNKPLGTPNGQMGNATIYRLENQRFENGDQVWEQVASSIEGAIRERNGIRFSKIEGTLQPSFIQKWGKLIVGILLLLMALYLLPLIC